MNISVPVANEIEKVSFSFASTEDIKKLSVKCINNPQTFDPVTGYPNINGLYDPALGPYDKLQTCTTCKLGYYQCPGHFGHIDLAVPVYHPLLFTNLFGLLRAKCFYCHHFKISHIKLYRYEARLKLAYAGLITDSMELESLDVMALDSEIEASEAFGENEKSFNALVFKKKLDMHVKSCFEKAGIKSAEATLNTLANDYIKNLHKDVLKDLALSKSCNSCGAKSPTLRKEANAKIFENPLTANEKSNNEAKGRKREGILNSEKKITEPGANDDLEKVVDAQMKKEKSLYITPLQAKEHLRLLWSYESGILDLLFGSFVKKDKKRIRKSNFEQFFMHAVSVPPSKFRPVSVLGDRQFDNAQNSHLIEVIKSNNLIIDLRNDEPEKDEEKKTTPSEVQKFEKMISYWVSLQENVNFLIDSSKNAKVKNPVAGIKQIMEKKEGLFRKHMMGKRVNYAARSVISPDPNIETSEIGVPLVFATKLTYPEPVTQYNVTELMEAVVNGPNEYPGAISIQLEDGSLTFLNNCSKDQRIALASQLLKPAPNLRSSEDVSFVNKKVYRHIKNGDMVIMNRQPTLHKPSMMAHTVKVLPGEKTIRMHYANCNTYNADFDGDEMNMHFPQNAIAQAEARLIMNNNNQYLVPTNGEPLRGLIQDHVVTGVMMSSRNTFLTNEEYCNLVYASLVDHVKGRLIMVEPAVIKPEKLWTGKQVISTLLKNLTIGEKQMNLDSKSQVPSKSWSVLQKVDTEEGNVIVRDGNLLTGILDKKQFGAKAKGLVHAVYEIYGADTAAKLLTSLGRLFCRYVQMIGFSCRMEDLVLNPAADSYRKDKIRAALAQGKQIMKEFVSESGELAALPETPFEKKTRNKLPKGKISSDERDRLEKMLSALEDKRLYQAMENTIRSDQKLAQLDGKMKSKTGTVTTDIVKEIIPNGLRKPFPDNGMQLMTVSGAKGSNVNVTQISCMLGQQELEGRRVPVMVSGKTLPSFRAYDLGPRAGGFITGRFLTGIKPQEYYFHCMAGREGLVDTAVKTARSGYLQRCLIKHLEGMKVGYDATVRDSADGSIVQFYYGEDSLDVTKASYLNDFKFNAQNYHAFLDRYRPDLAGQVLNTDKADKFSKKAERRPEKYLPVMAKYNPHLFLGSISESFYGDLKKYIESNPHKVISNKSALFPSKEGFDAFMKLKYHRCLVEPGEAVGLLAAQSIGEPSTQMTLNTFHFAGHGAKNVTLGIPRLREIIMTASAKLKTPQMTIPFVPTVSKAQAELIARKMSRLTLDMVLEDATVKERLMPLGGTGRERSYTIRLNFCDAAQYQEEYGLDFSAIRENVECVFIKKLIFAIKKLGKRGNTKDEEEEIGKGVDIKKFNESVSHVEVESEDTPKKKDKDKIKSVASDDEDDEDLDAIAAARKKKHKEHASYDEPDEDEVVKEENDDFDFDSKNDNKADVAQDDTEAREEVIKGNSFVHDYQFDTKNQGWCQIELRFSADKKKLLMVDIVENVVHQCVISEISGISKCFVSKDENNNLYLLTEGVNIRGMYAYDEYLDIKRLQSNDIAALKECYGVEAARKTIVKEVSSVFAVYGIEVDVRHLSLIADYMTFQGGYKPFNRGGIESSSSPFAKMSFETAFHFLTQATLKGESDELQNPSACLVMGKVVKGGTGSFEVHHNLAIK